ncbi:hypothetical protein QP860_09475 [Aerococcus sp. UMB1112A]|uniref:hypothetical protein n=1 Tax=Aerococcus sp. UMB1112A TaxID=3050609 RepID=UPI00254EA791|nr:hypothetical protein [Aerococcus sp. UMB1112A]MDK8503275.1 hypothetical protein [Aerococcus sp. UMB1112A]
MSTEYIQAAYDKVNQANLIMMQALDFSYTEAWHENLQNIANGVLQVIDGQPNPEIAQKIQALYDQVDWDKFSERERLQVLQLIFLEAERQDQLQANHQMTPAGIAMLLTYFASRLLQTRGQSKETPLKVFDPTVGFRVIIVIEANSYVNTRSSRLLPKFKTQKINSWCAA